MAIASTTAWEVRTDGDDNNGGGFDPVGGGTDYSQQAAAQLSVTDGSGSGTTNLNSATGGFTAAMVGNILQITGGTLTAGFYEITAYVDSNNVTLDRTPGTGSGSTVKVGGALATVDKADDAVVPGNVVFIKAGTYTRTATWSLTADGSTTGYIRFVGYNTNRTISNSDTRPLITTATNSVRILEPNGANYCLFHNLNFSTTATTKANFMANISFTSANIQFQFCKFEDFPTVYSRETSNSATVEWWFCEFSGCTGSALHVASSSGSLNVFFCYFHDCLTGISTAANAGTVTLMNCIFDTMSSYGLSLTRTTTSVADIVVEECIFYNCATNGIRYIGNAAIYFNSRSRLLNNIFVGGTYAIYAQNADTIRPLHLYRNNAFYNQTFRYNNFSDPEGTDITLTADPFVDAANGNFALNNTAGGGAVARAAALPASFPGGLTANFRDLGPSQHQDSGGSSPVPRAFAYIG